TRRDCSCTASSPPPTFRIAMVASPCWRRSSACFPSSRSCSPTAPTRDRSFASRSPSSSSRPSASCYESSAIPAKVSGQTLSFVPVGGNDYFPFIWLAKSLELPWFILSDAESHPLHMLDRSLAKAGFSNRAQLANVITMDAGNDFAAQLLADGYAPEIEAAFDAYHQTQDYISQYVQIQQGQKKKGGGLKDFNVPDGRHLAILDALSLQKTSMAAPCATCIAAIADDSRAPPPRVGMIFNEMSAKLGWAARTPTP